MYQKIKKTKYYSTNLYPPQKIIIDGPCEIIFEQVNSFGQGVFSFVIDNKCSVETFKIKPKRENINGNK